MKLDDVQSPQLCDDHKPKHPNPRRSTIFKAINDINLTKSDNKYQKKNDILVAQIQKIVKYMPSDDRQLKVERYIYDAYYLRTIRNDIDMSDKVLLLCGMGFINNQYDKTQLRFSLMIRPILMIFYSKDLSSNLKGIVNASRDLLLLFLLYAIIQSTFSFIGINLIGQLQTVNCRLGYLGLWRFLQIIQYIIYDCHS